jgi:hypothetical protein
MCFPPPQKNNTIRQLLFLEHLMIEMSTLQHWLQSLNVHRLSVWWLWHCYDVQMSCVIERSLGYIYPRVCQICVVKVFDMRMIVMKNFLCSKCSFHKSQDISITDQCKVKTKHIIYLFSIIWHHCTFFPVWLWILRDHYSLQETLKIIYPYKTAASYL